MAAPMGWERYVGLQGEVVGINRFGASAPYKVILEQFGFTGENVALRALVVLDRTRR
jgi:transketolase